MRRKLVIASIVSSFLITGCGIKGDLKTPDPIWGKKKSEQPKDPDTKPKDPAPTSP